MNYSDVVALNAEIIDAFVGVPTGGWAELAVEQLRQLHQDAAKLVEQLATGFNAEAYREASLLRNSFIQGFGSGAYRRTRVWCVFCGRKVGVSNYKGNLKRLCGIVNYGASQPGHAPSMIRAPKPKQC